MCYREQRSLEWLKREGERFRTELEKGTEGRYPELADLVKRLKEDKK